MKRAEISNSFKNNATHKNLKIGVWIYVLLLIFEGALRKWVFPSLANPLLLVRDPVAIWLIVSSIRCRLLKPNFILISFICIGVFSFITAVLFCHGSETVALFGLRAFILHLPLIFVIGRIFTREDCLKVGYFFIIAMIPMLLITILQFYSPQTSLINIGVGGNEEGAGFGGALGFYRPPGTFSFINGLTLFYGMTSAYTFYFLINIGKLPRYLVITALICTLASIPFTISRTVLYQNFLCLAFVSVIILRRPNYLKYAIGGVFFTVLAIVAFSDNAMFKSAFEAFSARFTDASETEGGIANSVFDRTLGGLIDAIFNSLDRSFWGDGLGSFSSYGFKTLGKANDIAITDFEWSRILQELGVVLGLLLIYVRIAMTFKLFRKAFSRLKHDDFLPWMLMSFGLITLLQGQIAQPTSLGFLTLIGGLVYASFNTTYKISHKKEIA